MSFAARLDLAQGGVWCVDPGRFRSYVARALAAPCPSSREVAKERRKRLEWFAAAPARALASTGRDLAAEGGGRKQLRALKGKTAVVPVFGPIGQRYSAEIAKASGTTTEELSAALDSLLADRSVEGIVFQFDSPGGSAYGLSELSDKIYAARNVKPCFAIADSVCASAALWLATSCGHDDTARMFCTPGGEVGSVGCWAMHLDQSQADAMEGVKVTFVAAGRYKTEGNPHEPLAPEAAAYIQTQVDYTAARFEDALARNRGVSRQTVRERYGEGRVMNGEQALAVGLVDRVMPLSDLLARLTGGAVDTGASGRRTDVLRLRHELAKLRSA